VPTPLLRLRPEDRPPPTGGGHRISGVRPIPGASGGHTKEPIS